MNKIILITTRDYYSLNTQINSLREVSLENFSKLVHAIIEMNHTPANNERRMAIIMGKGKGTATVYKNPLDAIKEMFIKGGSPEDKKKYNGFWERWDYKFYLKCLSVSSSKKRQEEQEAIKKQENEAVTYDIYVAPCFPTNFKDTNLEIRHQYLKEIFGDLLNTNSILLAHDLDLFINNDERFLTKEDCEAANNVLTEKIINFSNVFGFQHVDDPHTIYADFVKKISINTLTSESCDNMIEMLKKEDKNQNYYKQIDEFPFQSGPKSLKELESLIQKIVKV